MGQVTHSKTHVGLKFIFIPIWSEKIHLFFDSILIY